MRQVAGDGEHHVVVIWCHDFDVGAECFPERLQLRHSRRIGVRFRCQDAPAAVEQFCKSRFRAGFFGAGNRMSGDKVHTLRDMRGHVPHDRAFDGADVGDDGAGRQNG